MRAAVTTTIAGISLIALASFALSGGSSARAQSTITIEVGDAWFCDPGDSACMTSDFDDVDIVTTVDIGDTVVWEWGPGGSGTGAPHTTTNCADNFTNCSGPREWDSAPATTSGTFSHTFGPEDAGKTFLYRCEIHPTLMRGQITVVAAEEPTPTSTATPTPPPTATPTPTPAAPQASPPASPESVTPTPVNVLAAAVPEGGGLPPGESGASTLWWLAVLAGGLAVASSAVILLRASRR